MRYCTAWGRQTLPLHALLLALTVSVPAFADWPSESVESPIHVDGTSLAIASDDTINIALGGDALRLATSDGSGGWSDSSDKLKSKKGRTCPTRS